MKGNCRSKCWGFCAWAVVGVAAGGAAVMLLWNWLTPTLFGWKAISFLQAVGLLVLSRILFGGFHRRCGYGRHHGMAARLEAMTPEQREQFLAGMQSRWWCCKPGKADESAPEENGNK